MTNRKPTLVVIEPYFEDRLKPSENPIRCYKCKAVMIKTSTFFDNTNHPTSIEYECPKKECDNN